MKYALLFLFASSLSTLADEPLEPSTPNPGLHYYYPVPAASPPQVIQVDVCVYGGTPGGVAAAVQSTRMGKKAALAVFDRHVGGMTSGGLTEMDIGTMGAIGGMASDFITHLGRGGFRPSVAEKKFLTLLQEAGVPVYFEHRLQDVVKSGNHITALKFENGNTIEAKMFIDATYEGDLLARAGVSYRVGREDNSAYGETVNGFQIAKQHQFLFPVDPYRTPGNPASGLLPGISPDPPRPPGTGDKLVQAYNFRMWAVKSANGIPWPKPVGYNADDYALLLRYLNGKPGFVWIFNYTTGPLKLNVGDCNSAGPFSTDFIGGSSAWPEASYADREHIFQQHVTYQQGLMWFLANDPGVPEAVRTHVQGFGLPKDEFVETGGWPHELYVREGRRMISDYVMTEHNCTSDIIAQDSVGLASYQMDSHNTSRVVVDGTVRAEGCVAKKSPKPFQISYRSIVPKQGECDNILVPVCLSATHIAYGAIRMEPVFMVLGQSAATAAAMAIDANVPVQKVDYAELRKRLLADKQVLDTFIPPPPVPRSPPKPRAMQSSPASPTPIITPAPPPPPPPPNSPTPSVAPPTP